MKKLLLLSAFLIFACSSDDSSNNDNNSNQTFLEKYNGVVWEESDGSISTITFFANPPAMRTSLDENFDGVYCSYYVFEDENPDFYMEIIEMSEDEIIFSYVDYVDFNSYNITFNAEDSGNTLRALNNIENDEFYYYRTTLTNPCD